MTKREAYQIGLAIADEINENGDFSAKELADEDSFAEAFYEIVENRKQYAGEPTEDFRTDAQWQGYEDGLATRLALIITKRGLDQGPASNPGMSRGHFELIANVLYISRPEEGTPEYRLWEMIVNNFLAAFRTTNPNFSAFKFLKRVNS